MNGCTIKIRKIKIYSDSRLSRDNLNKLRKTSFKTSNDFWFLKAIEMMPVIINQDFL
jgi:hypothetical protein